MILFLNVRFHRDAEYGDKHIRRGGMNSIAN